ncbi:MAG: T9SS type A sorting domain-containing protein, partial [Bacteroidales bacterium]|nr:T9SS type A sorting domain-containing protein [Bacteroidales bacterium]
QMPYQWHGISVTTTGTYYDSLYTTTHCDSVYILNFLINQTYTGTDDLTICEGELPYTYGDSTFVAGTTSGIYHVMFETVTGCDSLISLSLIVIETYIGNDDLVLCETSFPYAIGDTVFEVGTVEGTYLVHFNSAVTGCDSLVYTTLTINPTLTNTIYDTICQLERYTENNFNIFAYNYGMIYDTLYEYSAVTNCDSIVYLELTVDPLPADVGEIYGENNIAFNETGTFVYEYYVEPVEFATYYIWELNYAPWLLVQDSSNVCTVYFSSREVGTLTVTAYNDCGKSLNSSEFVISTLTGIEDYDNQAKMLIYPNPASDYINIEFDNVEGEISLTVTDDSGRVIDVFSEIISSDRKLINHSVKSYSSGVYYVNVKSKKVSITDKFVKLR